MWVARTGEWNVRDVGRVLPEMWMRSSPCDLGEGRLPDDGCGGARCRRPLVVSPTALSSNSRLGITCPVSRQTERLVVWLRPRAVAMSDVGAVLPSSFEAGACPAIATTPPTRLVLRTRCTHRAPPASPRPPLWQLLGLLALGYLLRTIWKRHRPFLGFVRSTNAWST